MSQCHHHPDNLIYVRTPAATYCDTVDNFRLDFERTWPLPDGMVELRYDDTPPRTLLFDAAGNQHAGPTGRFPFGDAAIAAIATLLARQAARKKAAEEAAKPKPATNATAKTAAPSLGTRRV